MEDLGNPVDWNWLEEQKRYMGRAGMGEITNARMLTGADALSKERLMTNQFGVHPTVDKRMAEVLHDQGWNVEGVGNKDSGPSKDEKEGPKKDSAATEYVVTGKQSALGKVSGPEEEEPELHM